MVKSVPTGWKRGQSITIEKVTMGGKVRLRVSRPISLSFDEKIHADDIYCIHHNSFEEHCKFIKWWFQ